MRSFLILLFCCVSLASQGQISSFPKNYIGLNYTTGYYDDLEFINGYWVRNGVDFKTVGLQLARRLTKNVYVQSNAFAAGNSHFFFDLGIKLNALVTRKLQPHGSISLGTRLGMEGSSIFHYCLGLDYHVAPMIVLHSGAFSEFSNHTQGLRFGACYKF